MRLARRWRRVYFVLPTFRPVGGVVKILDYVNHARALGLRPVICCPEPFKEGLPVFENARFRGISPKNGLRFITPEKVSVGPQDLAFVSWPTNYEILEPRLSRWTDHEQVICIVQNVRWANPRWIGGYPLRLLSRPMARIMTNDVVLEACKPYLNQSSMTEVIDLGHEASFFAKERSGGLGPRIKVGYTAWKSDVGDRVAAAMDDSAFEFRAIRNPVGWGELRDLYHWSDVFLATPLAEEGFYLPGLEAMAAGAIILAPDSGGMRALYRFGENCLRVGFDDAGSYVEALRSLKAAGPGEVGRLRRNGYETTGRHTLAREGEHFGAFLGRLTERLDGPRPS